MKPEKYLKVLGQISHISGIPLATLEEKFYALPHDDKRSVIYDLKKVLRNYMDTSTLERLKKIFREQ